MAGFNSSQFWNNARKTRQTLAEMTAYISRNTSGSVIFTSYEKTLPGGGIHRVNSGASYKYVAGTDFADKISNGDGTTGNGFNAKGCTIATGAGNDFIENTAENVNIYAGTGNDTIDLYGSYDNVILYHSGDGNDLIKKFTSDIWDKNNKLVIGSGKYWTQEHGKDVIVHVGSGKITLEGARVRSGGLNIEGTYDYSAATIPSGKYIKNTDAPTVVTGTAYDDLIVSDVGAEPATMRSIWGYPVTIGSGGTVTINAGAGDDYINTYPGTANVINAGRGNDTISAFGKKIFIQYANGDGNDLIWADYPNATLSITGGTYTTQTSGNDVLVKVGSGTITLQGAKGQTLNIKGTKTTATPTISGGKKNIKNSKSNTTVSGTAYNDTITNTGSKVTIYGGEGTDKIYNNKGHYALIYGGTNNDYINAVNNYATIYGGPGKDTITGSHWRSKLSGDGDNDLISITSYWYNTIDGGLGNDTIIAGGGGHSVDGGAGNDRISLSGDNLTVKGGTGNDIIYGNTATSHLYQYTKGDGNDLIYNWSSKDTLQVTNATWTKTISGNNVIVDVKDSGKITLGGAKNKTVNVQSINTYSNRIIGGTSYADIITNYGSNVSINGGAGNDSLVSYSKGSKVTLLGGKGKDAIYSSSAYSRLDGGDDADYLYTSGNFSTVLGGAGNDTVKNYGSYNSILGGAGNDSIENALGSNVTINGGKGNDSLWGSSGADTFIYANGDGNDVIYGFGSNDLLQITGTFSASYNKTSGDVFFKVGSNTITLKNSTTTSFHVNNKIYKLK